MEYLSPDAPSVAAFAVGDLDNEFLREFLDDYPIVVIQESVNEIRQYVWEKFRDLLSLATPDVRMGILGILAASLGLGKTRILSHCLELIFTIEANLPITASPLHRFIANDKDFITFRNPLHSAARITIWKTSPLLY